MASAHATEPGEGTLDGCELQAALAPFLVRSSTLAPQAGRGRCGHAANDPTPLDYTAQHNREERQWQAQLAGEVAIVTGAGVNTGAVIAKTLAREGAAVVVNYRNAEDGARATVAAIEQEAARRSRCRAT